MGTPLTPMSASGLNVMLPSKTVQRIRTPKSASPSIEDFTHHEAESDAPLKEPIPTCSPPKIFGGPLAVDDDDGPMDVELSPPPQHVQSPIKISSPTTQQSPEKKRCREVDMAPLTPLRDNEGLTGVIRDSEVDASSRPERIWEDGQDQDEDSVMTLGPEDAAMDPDDTAFSAFSAVPNADMTLFARLGQRPKWGSDSSDRTVEGIPSLFSDSPGRKEEADLLTLEIRQEITPRCGRNDPLTPVRRANADMGDGDRTLSPSSTSRRRGCISVEPDNDTTNLILDFTDQFNALAGSSSSYTHTTPSKSNRRSPVKSHTQPNLAMHMARARTPSPSKKSAIPPATPTERRTLASLLDFDIPPAPTPRSIPSISARELESLKSTYLSQISSLKASLSGKEAETRSLMDAVGDAERRVGEAQETLREERGVREVLQANRDSWEVRAKEMEAVMCSVKDEVLAGERERNDLASKFEDAERRRDEAETKAAEAESRMAGMKAGWSSTSSTAPSGSTTTSDDISDLSQARKVGGTTMAKEVEIAVEKVARELHALYRSKHETKVSALKKSYEARWEKRVKELEGQLAQARHEMDGMKTRAKMTSTDVISPSTTNRRTSTSDEANGGEVDQGRKDEVLQRENLAREVQSLEEYKARNSGLYKELDSVKMDNDRLIVELERERVEKGDLVAAVEEMLSISNTSGLVNNSATGVLGTGIGGPTHYPGPRDGGPSNVLAGAGRPTRTQTGNGEQATVIHALHSFRGGVSRPSGRRPPVAPTGLGGGSLTESRIGRAHLTHSSTTTASNNNNNNNHHNSHLRSKSGGSVATLSAAGKSGIMSNIERMGKGGGGHGS